MLRALSLTFLMSVTMVVCSTITTGRACAQSGGSTKTSGGGRGWVTPPKRVVTPAPPKTSPKKGKQPAKRTALASPPVVLVRPPEPLQPSAQALAGFREDVSAQGEILEALARAKPAGRRVLVVWGSDADRDCPRFIAALESTAELRRILLYEYELVLVNVGTPVSVNIDTAFSYGARLQNTGVPYLTVLGENQQALVNVHGDYFSDGRGGHDAGKLQTFLRNLQAMSPVADDVYDAGLRAARTANQLALVHFTSPASPRGRQIDDWFARRDVIASITGATRIRIDVERMIHGRDTMRRVTGDRNADAPCFALVDPRSGTTMATSIDAIGNPWGSLASAPAVAHFRDMLIRAGTPLNNDQLDALLRPLLPQPPPEATGPASTGADASPSPALVGPKSAEPPPPDGPATPRSNQPPDAPATDARAPTQ